MLFASRPAQLFEHGWRRFGEGTEQEAVNEVAQCIVCMHPNKNGNEVWEQTQVEILLDLDPRWVCIIMIASQMLRDNQEVRATVAGSRRNISNCIINVTGEVMRVKKTIRLLTPKQIGAVLPKR